MPICCLAAVCSLPRADTVLMRKHTVLAWAAVAQWLDGIAVEAHQSDHAPSPVLTL